MGTQWPLSGPSETEQPHFEGQDPIAREAQIPETAGLKTLPNLPLISLCWDWDIFLCSCVTHISNHSIYTVYPYKWILMNMIIYSLQQKKMSKVWWQKEIFHFHLQSKSFLYSKKKKQPVEQCKHSWILQVAVPDPILLKTKRKFLQELMWLQISCDHKPLFSVTGLRLHLEMRCKLDIYPMTWFCSCSVHIVTAADPFIQR